MPSSTSSSNAPALDARTEDRAGYGADVPQRSFGRSALVVIVAAVCVIGTVGVGLAFLAKGGGEGPPLPYFPSLESEALRFNRTTRSDNEVLLIGSSLVRHGIIEERLATELNGSQWSVANLALDGGTLWENAALVDRLREPSSPSERIAIVEVNRVEFDGNRQLTAIGKRLWAYYDSSASTSRKLLAFLPPRQPIDAWVQQTVYGRLAYRLPRLIKTPEVPPRSLWTVGVESQRRAVREMLPVPLATTLKGRRVSRSMTAALGHIVRELKRRHYRVVLLETPMHSDFLRTLEDQDGTEPEREFQEALRDARLVGADTILAYRSAAALGAQDDIFVDYGHMTKQGAMLQTDSIASFLNRLQGSVSRK